jgi:putrescine transport system substrate-binding protein
MRITRTIARAALTALLLIPGLNACSTDTKSDATPSVENVLNVYNWADYIGPDTLAKFEAEYGIKVNYDLYDSSGIVDVKMLTGNSGYDVVIHSNQYASRLAPIGVYEKLDMSRLPNARHLDPAMMVQVDVYELVRGYMLPYHWGTTGYAWNADMVRERLPNHPMDSADVLFDPEVASKLADCGISLLDGPTDLIGTALAYLGRDPSAVDDENLAAAEELLAGVRPYIRYFSNEKMMVDMPNNEVCVAQTWSGDYATAAVRAREAGIDIDLRYSIPKEGTAMWVDGFYIPADAPHRDNAYLFIDFMLRPDIAAENANEVYYANVNRSSWEFTKPEILSDPAIYPDEEIWERMYVVRVADPKRQRARTRTFARIKSGL